LRSKAPVSNPETFEQFFPKETTDIRTTGTEPYHKVNCSYKLHNFRLIQIEGPKQIEVLREFVWPVYEAGTQRIFFSDDYSMLYEQLSRARVFLYEWKGTAGESKGKF